MTDVTTTALPAPRPVRPRTTLVAALFVAAGALVGFFGLVALYVARRAQALNAGQDWFDADAVELGPPGFIFATLILSVFTVQWAVHATRHDDRVNAYWALAITGLFGAAVFTQLWFILAETGFSVDGGEADSGRLTAWQRSSLAPWASFVCYARTSTRSWRSCWLLPISPRSTSLSPP